MVETVEILPAFLPDIRKPRTYRHIKEQCGIASNNGLQRLLRRLIKEGLLEREKVGSTYLYRWRSHRALYPLVELAVRDILTRKRVADDVDTLCKEVQREAPLSIALVFGSYAKDAEKDSSDLDVAVIAPKRFDQGDTVRERLSRRVLVKLDLQFFTMKEFQKMLAAPYENVGKQIAAANLPVKGAEAFYALLNPRGA
ncbi:MAG: nucleotidyltransferase domain-containing protein [Candidatus Woesearchaeota archaeon]